MLIAGFVAYAAITVAVSDICIGNPPGFKRSYTRILGKTLVRLLGASMLRTLVAVVVPILGIVVVHVMLHEYPWMADLAYVLLVIGGIVLGLWLMLCPPIVVLEEKSVFGALRRSNQLGDGSHWRNVGLLLSLLVLLGFSSGVIAAVFWMVFSNMVGKRVFTALPLLIQLMQQGVAFPVTIIALVLVYYDRRVRKEGYDLKSLADDLSR